MFENIG